MIEIRRASWGGSMIATNMAAAAPTSSSRVTPRAVARSLAAQAWSREVTVDATEDQPGRTSTKIASANSTSPKHEVEDVFQAIERRSLALGVALHLAQPPETLGLHPPTSARKSSTATGAFLLTASAVQPRSRTSRPARHRHRARTSRAASTTSSADVGPRQATAARPASSRPSRTTDEDVPWARRSTDASKLLWHEGRVTLSSRRCSPRDREGPACKVERNFQIRKNIPEARREVAGAPASGVLRPALTRARGPRRPRAWHGLHPRLLPRRSGCTSTPGTPRSAAPCSSVRRSTFPPGAPPLPQGP